MKKWKSTILRWPEDVTSFLNNLKLQPEDVKITEYDRFYTIFYYVQDE